MTNVIYACSGHGIINNLDKRTSALVESILLKMPADLKECAKRDESFRAVVTACIAVNIAKAFIKCWGEIDDKKEIR